VVLGIGLVDLGIVNLDKTNVFPTDDQVFLALAGHPWEGQVFFHRAKANALAHLDWVGDQHVVAVSLTWTHRHNLTGVGQLLHDYMEDFAFDSLDGSNDDLVT
jgi:hypothetical protein